MNYQVKTVCIQHGIFSNMKYPLRIDGRLSDINFVWDFNQVNIIGCDKNAAFEIGLPYAAAAMPTTELAVILVGTGMAFDGTGDYEESLSFFTQLSAELSQTLGLKVLYRPHPVESNCVNLIIELRKKFTLLDELDKVRRMNGPRAVFIGTTSSLLHEAAVAGHFIAHVKLYKKATPNFEFDFEFEPQEIGTLVEWVSTLDASSCTRGGFTHTGGDCPTERFVCALHAAKLIDINYVEANRKHIAQTDRTVIQ